MCLLSYWEWRCISWRPNLELWGWKAVMRMRGKTEGRTGSQRERVSNNCLQRFCYMRNSAPAGSNHCQASGTKDIPWFVTHCLKSWWGLEEKCIRKNKWTQSYFLTPFCLTRLTLFSLLLPISPTVLLFRLLSSASWISVATFCSPASDLLPTGLPLCHTVTRIFRISS